MGRRCCIRSRESARERALELRKLRRRKRMRRCMMRIRASNGARHGLEDSKDEKGDDITVAPVLNIAIKKRKKAMKDNHEDDDYDMEKMEDGEEDGDNDNEAPTLKIAAKNKGKSKKGAKEHRNSIKVAERHKRAKKHEETTRKKLRGAGVGEKM